MLGPSHAVTYLRMASGIPAEQAVHWQRLRPGSGCLSVKVVTDGPTRVLHISDVRNSRPSTSLTPVLDSSSSSSAASSSSSSSSAPPPASKELQVGMLFRGGLAISLVKHAPPEELAYCRLTNICLEVVAGRTLMTLDASVQTVQIDNPLADPQSAVALYVTPAGSSSHEDSAAAARHLMGPALHVSVQRAGADIYRQLVVTFKNLTINIEESQLFKLLAFAGFNQSDLELERVDESDYETQRSLNAATSVHAKRYYFGLLKLALDQVRLSVFTTSKLAAELKAIKRKLGLTLIRFEDANIELDPFIRQHPFESSQLLIDSIVKHYKVLTT